MTVRTGTTDIDAVISGAARDAGLDPDAARAAMTAALGLLDRHGAPDAMAAVYERVAGARAMALAAGKPRGGGLFGGLMRSAGGVSGKAMADAMAVLEQLKQSGVGKDDLKRLLPAARARVRGATGRDLLGEAVKSVPGVGALLGAD